MGIYVGTSGYSHANWKAAFYPEKISQKKMLEYYAQYFQMTEVNYTFRQLPTRKVVVGWAERVPPTFRFVLKAQQHITHVKRLQNAQEATDAFLDVASALGQKQGPILFQLPPSFK